ncbi:ArsR/SmtB family transcription factor [Denitrobaculum tricleocarpae]|uniref:Winged helix-turn-helix transcriptional regulator n=1 Tax=Denitrobaculum tricleocarpae TaxID=2591009 RepID=A0A545TRB7_9PROT|nr:helix-turn-helix domain-containing protein [Denitrobaculum tricleocarpae]TQV79759.1 winged helix-turn-helix transcriptional regulator [Denitrobaculum tricleocarpae]
MHSNDAIAALLALGQETRLNAYRLLLMQGSKGLRVSEISKRLSVNISTLSRHLGQLERTGLLQSWRHEREIIYAVHDSGMQELINYLLENCCRESGEACERADPSQKT